MDQQHARLFHRQGLDKAGQRGGHAAGGAPDHAETMTRMPQARIVEHRLVDRFAVKRQPGLQDVGAVLLGAEHADAVAPLLQGERDAQHGKQVAGGADRHDDEVNGGVDGGPWWPMAA